MNQKEILLKSLKEKGFSKQILKAFEKVKREDFIPENLKDKLIPESKIGVMLLLEEEEAGWTGR